MASATHTIITLNRVPNNTLQQTSSPDITTVSNTLYNGISWIGQNALSSGHLPFITTINIRHDYRQQQYRRTFTNYKTADWAQFTEDTESAFAQTTIPIYLHTANRIFTSIILMADKHNIPKGKMHNYYRLLPDHIVCKIAQRNNMMRENTWNHSHNTHIIWKTIHGLSNIARPPTLNTFITFNNKITTSPKNIKTVTNQHSSHTHEVHRKLHQGTQSIHLIQKPHIHATSI